MFTSPTCFRDLRLIIREPHRPEGPSHGPFLRGLGNLCFRTRSARLASSGDRSWLAECLGGGDTYFDPDAPGEPPDDDFVESADGTFFGYDPAITDQRMYGLYYELERPLPLRAEADGATQATGKAFVHLYPSGYGVISLALALRQQSADELGGSIREATPWRRGSWTWTTPLGSTTLGDLVDSIRDRISTSVLTAGSVGTGDWTSAYRLAGERREGPDIARRLFRGEFDTFDLRCRDVWDDREPVFGSLYTSKHGLLYASDRPRKNVLRMFWKIQLLHEFVVLKKKVYRDYSEFLRLETLRIGQGARGASPAMAGYPSDEPSASQTGTLLPVYAYALDKYIRSAMGMHRRLYSSLSRGLEFDQVHDTFRRLTNDWEQAVAKTPVQADPEWDVFISYAREDGEVARQLRDMLIRKGNGLKVWMDDKEVLPGSELRRTLLEGLRGSRVVLALISPTYLRKHWTQIELGGAFAFKLDKAGVIPVLHDIERETAIEAVGAIAGLLSVSTASGLDAVADDVLRVLPSP